ncbi:unnamed protein product [Clonostachys rhizophaga]|uniref:Uncharacterized protein n=1 Tax=Clonostachys rhizophaga TaxID=160324 RepID=A0A9N9YRW8_9HYPO|nr:unnamed protein product [Clonostachys rhizophaga]
MEIYYILIKVKNKLKIRILKGLYIETITLYQGYYNTYHDPDNTPYCSYLVIIPIFFNNNLAAFFTKASLTWQAGAYHRTDIALNSELATTLVPDLSTRFSMKALFLKGVEPAAVLYGPDQRSFTQSVVFPSEKVQDLTEAAIAFAQVGNSKVGYVGDVNRERETDAAIVAMCLRARPNASLA